MVAKFPLGYTPRLEWRGYRVSAGIAYYREGLIGLSAVVLKDEAAVIETVGHEFAHLLAVARHGRKAANHGPYWQQAMRDIGLEPNVRHQMPVERNVARQQVVYRCLKCGGEFTRGRRLNARRKYIHVHCGGDLKLVRIERIA